MLILNGEFAVQKQVFDVFFCLRVHISSPSRLTALQYDFVSVFMRVTYKKRLQGSRRPRLILLGLFLCKNLPYVELCPFFLFVLLKSSSKKPDNHIFQNLKPVFDTENIRSASWRIMCYSMENSTCKPFVTASPTGIRIRVVLVEV